MPIRLYITHCDPEGLCRVTLGYIPNMIKPGLLQQRTLLFGDSQHTVVTQLINAVKHATLVVLDT